MTAVSILAFGSGNGSSADCVRNLTSTGLFPLACVPFAGVRQKDRRRRRTELRANKIPNSVQNQYLSPAPRRERVESTPLANERYPYSSLRCRSGGAGRILRRTPSISLIAVATGLFATRRRISGNIEDVSMRSLVIPRLVNYFSYSFSPSSPERQTEQPQFHR